MGGERGKSRRKRIGLILLFASSGKMKALKFFSKEKQATPSLFFFSQLAYLLALMKNEGRMERQGMETPWHWAENSIP